MKNKFLKILVFMLTVALMCASFAFVASAETEEVTTPTTGTHKFTIVAEGGAETPFEGTLKAALAARTADTDFVRLEADATFGQNDRIKGVGNVNIDFNGKNVTFATTSSHFLYDCSNIHLKNGNIDASGCAGNFIYTTQNYVGVLTLEDLNVINAEGLTEVRAASDFVIDGCTFTTATSDDIFYQRITGADFSWTVTDTTFNAATTATGQCVLYFSNFGTAEVSPVVSLSFKDVEVNAPSAEFVDLKQQSGAVATPKLNATFENITVAEGTADFERYIRATGANYIVDNVKGIGENAPVYGYSTASEIYFGKADTTLASVLTASGRTVYLCQDNTTTDQVTARTNITLDFMGNTLTVNRTAHWIKTGAITWVFKDGSLVLSGSGNIQNMNGTSGTSDFTFKNMNVTWGSMFDARATTTNITIEDSTINATGYVGAIRQNANITIKNSTVNGKWTLNDYSTGDLVDNIYVENSTLNGTFSSTASTTDGTKTVNFKFVGDCTLPSTLVSNEDKASVVVATDVLECSGATSSILGSDVTNIGGAIQKFLSVKLLANYSEFYYGEPFTPVDGCVLDLNGNAFVNKTYDGANLIKLKNGSTFTIKNGTVEMGNDGGFVIGDVAGYGYTLNLTDLEVVTSAVAGCIPFSVKSMSMTVNATNVSISGDGSGVFEFGGCLAYYNAETGKYQVSSTDDTEVEQLITFNWVGGRVNQPEMGDGAVINILDSSDNNFAFDINISDVDFGIGTGEVIELSSADNTGINTTDITVTGCNIEKAGYFIDNNHRTFTVNASLTDMTALTTVDFIEGKANVTEADVTFRVGSHGSTYVEGYVGDNSPAAFFTVGYDGSFSYKVSIIVNSNLTLYSDFDYNLVIYVDESSALTSVKINGVEYTAYPADDLDVAKDGFKTYLVTYENIAPASANDAFTVEYVVTYSDGSELIASQTHSIAKYAKKLLDGADTNEAYAKSKQLIIDMLTYIKEAYAYADLECADILEVLGDNVATEYDSTKDEDTSLDGTGITTAKLVLGNEPVVRFYLASGFSGSVKVSYTDIFGNAQESVLELATADDGRVYGDFITKLCNMTEVLTVNVNGNEGTYDIYDYSNGLPESDGSKALVKALVAYAESAREYQRPRDQYVIVFDTDGAGEIESVTVIEGDSLTLPAAPTKEGYEFLGWYADGVKLGESFVPTSSVTVTAKWGRGFKVSFEEEDGTVIDLIMVDDGNSFDLLAAPTKDGYEFLGWYYGETKLEAGFAPTEDVVIVAKWIKKHTVSFDTDGAGEIESVTVLDGESVTIPDALTKDGYVFLGWYVGDEKVEGSYVPTGDVTVTAKWIKKHTVSFDTDGVGEIESVTVLDGESVTIPDALTKDGYVFLGWYIGDAKVEGSYVPTADVTVTAKFRELYVYNVSFDTDGGSTVDDIKVTEGDSFGLPAGPTKAGYKFLGWYYNNELLTEGFVPTEDVVIVAEYRELEIYFITMLDEEENYLGEIEIDEGDFFDLPGDPDKFGYKFLGWYYGDELLTEGFVATESVTLIGKFRELETYNVTLEDEEGNLLGGFVVVEGEVFELPEEAFLEGYKFLGWYYEGELLTEGFVPTEDFTLVAKFRPLEVYTVSFNTNGGSAVEDIEVVEGDVFTLPEDPVKDGGIFLGWYCDGELLTEGFEPTSDVTITAEWIETDTPWVDSEF